MGSGSFEEQQLGRPEVPEVPEGTQLPPLPSPALGEILRNDLIPVGVGAGPSHTLLFTGVYGKPCKVLCFLMLLPDRGHFL